MSFHFPGRLNFKSETRFAVAVRGGPQWNIPKLFIRISFICSLSAWNPGRLRDDETPGQSSIINDKTRPKMRILYSVSFYLFPLSVRFLYSWVTLISAPKKNEGKEKVSEIISCTLRKFYLAGYRYSLSRNRWRCTTKDQPSSGTAKIQQNGGSSEIPQDLNSLVVLWSCSP